MISFRRHRFSTSNFCSTWDFLRSELGMRTRRPRYLQNARLLSSACVKFRFLPNVAGRREPLGTANRIARLRSRVFAAWCAHSFPLIPAKRSPRSRKSHCCFPSCCEQEKHLYRSKMYTRVCAPVLVANGIQRSNVRSKFNMNLPAICLVTRDGCY